MSLKNNLSVFSSMSFFTVKKTIQNLHYGYTIKNQSK